MADVTHAQKTVLIVGSDMRDLARSDPALLRSKLDRDGLLRGNHRIVLLHWCTETYTIHLDAQITAIRIRTRFAHVRPLHDALFRLYARRILARERITPDVCVAYDVGMAHALLPLVRRLHAKLVLMVCYVPSTILETRRGAFVRGWYQRVCERLVLPHIDRACAISDTTEQYVRDRHVPAEKITRFTPRTIPQNVTELVEQSRGKLRARYAIPPDTHIILCVGRLEPEKGHDRLLRVFADMQRNDLVLVLAGDGVLRHTLEEQARTLGIAERVIFTGAVPHDDVWGYYADADVFVLLSRSEALGLVVWEAFATGVPAIVSDTEGLRESAGEQSERAFVWDERMGAGVFREYIDACVENGKNVQKMRTNASAYVQEKMDHGDSLSPLTML